MSTIIVLPGAPERFWSTVNTILGAGFEITVNHQAIYTIITNLGDLVKVSKNITPNSIAIICDHEEEIGDGPHCFMRDDLGFRPYGLVHWVKNPGVFKDEPLNNILMVQGGKSVKKAFHDVFAEHPAITTRLGFSICRKTIPSVVPTSHMTSIGETQYICRRTTEGTIVRVIEDPGVTREEKTLAVLWLLFPYAEDLIKTKATMIDYAEQSDMPNQGNVLGLVFQDPVTSKKIIGYLGIFTLGHAYSRAEKFSEQLCRRLKAACTGRGFEPPTVQDIASYITTSGWKHGDVHGIVEDVLGRIICETEEGDYNVEATMAQLKPIETIEREHQLKPIASELLGQARLVYSGYHSTSLHFVLPVIDLIDGTIGANDNSIRQEIQGFRQVQDVVNASPYMGLRSKLPEKYHIKNYCQLVYAGLKYHEASLTNDNDKEAFKLYRVDDIKTHISESTRAKFVEVLTQSLESPTITSLVSLVKILPLDKAMKLMTTKQADERSRVLEALRTDPNPGAWATAMITQEDTVAQQKMAEEAVSLVTERFRTATAIEHDRLEGILDQNERGQARARLNNWRVNVQQQIDQLASWEDKITQGTSVGQRTYRANLIQQIRGILELIRNPHGDQMEVQ